MAFESVYEREFPPLFRYVHRSTGDEEVAADITQECFARLLDADVPEGEARPWLFRVASNLIRDRHREGTRRRRLLERWGTPTDVVGHSETERSLEVARVRRALDSIPERDRMMLMLREEGFSYEEIAAQVDVAATSVGTLLRRSLQRFRKAYERG